MKLYHGHATQPYRPSIPEAYEEAIVAYEKASTHPDHWTSNVGALGMTRISPTVMKAAKASHDAMWDAYDAAWDEDPTAGFTYEITWEIR